MLIAKVWIFFIIKVKSSDEISHTLIGESGQTRIELEYKKLKIVIQESFKLFRMLSWF